MTNDTQVIAIGASDIEVAERKGNEFTAGIHKALTTDLIKYTYLEIILEGVRRINL